MARRPRSHKYSLTIIRSNEILERTKYSLTDLSVLTPTRSTKFHAEQSRMMWLSGIEARSSARWQRATRFLSIASGMLGVFGARLQQDSLLFGSTAVSTSMSALPLVFVVSKRGEGKQYISLFEKSSWKI